MKISELIDSLETIKAASGDLRLVSEIDGITLV
jgi:hypothetical protein